ncbi:MAG: rRNA maturation RNase YbeY [Steroidobacteraceae bacterium]
MTSRRPLAVETLGRRGAGIPAPAALRRWARLAVGNAGRGRRLAVRIVTRPQSRALNAQWRGRDYPTNVLSFPSPPAVAATELGDLAICAAVVRAEARAQRKPLRAHWAHLTVHGCLHLIGYDHERDADAARMERREVALLARLGIGNPYRSAADKGP